MTGTTREDSTEERLSQEKARRRERRNQQRQRAEERLEQLQRKLSSDYNNQMEEQEKLKTAHLRFAEMVKCHLKCGICLELYSDPIK
ncbi:hypothetical protein L596_001149 [Steinernema carpocapsae]|uniref:Uncharacterized protein n=1 Tax=Steinernema carpocapsae TaxID=34508 RepID=A0A4U8UMH8_STECR|nr:hypothetical protein L596_001149 [Steinernema carpocapsae]